MWSRPASFRRRSTSCGVPIRGTTTLQIASSFVQKLRRQGWRLQAIAPATLRGKTLTLPIAPTGPLSIFHSDVVAAGREVCPRVLRHSQSRLHDPSRRRYPSLSPGWESLPAAARQACYQPAHRPPQLSLPGRARPQRRKERQPHQGSTGFQCGHPRWQHLWIRPPCEQIDLPGQVRHEADQRLLGQSRHRLGQAGNHVGPLRRRGVERARAAGRLFLGLGRSRPASWRR